MPNDKTPEDRLREGMFNAVKVFLRSLTDEERLSLFDDFCKYCGCIEDQGPCHCMNDE